MKIKNMLICDTNELYAAELGSYIMNHFKNIQITIFTSTESFFADEKEFDIGVLSLDFMEIAGFKGKGLIKTAYLLTEERNMSNTSGYRQLYRYRPMTEIIGDIKELPGNAEMLEEKIDSTPSFITAIYSPINHELSMPFALSLCRSFLERGRVLFVDLEELSILPSLIGNQKERDLSDYLYYISGKHDGTKTEEYISSYMGIDYFAPFSNPAEISDIDRVTWAQFFNEIGSLGYDNIVVLLGRSLAGFTNILGSMKQIILLGRNGDYYQKSVELFMRYIRLCDLKIPVITTNLSMSASNLTDGSYRVDELLSGNLGVFVRKLIMDKNIMAGGTEGRYSACG